MRICIRGRLLMRIVIDDRRSWPVEDGTIHLRNSLEAIDWFETHRDTHIDELWLDHDLGYVPSIGIDSIIPVVQYIEQRTADEDPLDIDEIFVHSANPSAVNRIVKNNLLQNHYLVFAASKPRVLDDECVNLMLEWSWAPW